MKIVILDGFTTNSHDLSWAPIEALGELTVYDRTEPSQVLERAKGFEVVIINKVELTGEILAQLPDLKLVAYLATGYNSIDLQAANKQGILIANAPDYGSESVAQHAFALLLALTNQAMIHHESTKKGEWTNSIDWTYRKTPLIELAGKTMGIVGLGRIGSKTAAIAKGMGMRVIAYNRNPKKFEGVRFVGLKELFEESDVVSLHCPLTNENKGFVNRNLLKKMKASAFLINTGRGPLINEGDLAEALNNDQIAGAGLDVLSSEPPEEDNPLWSAKNCIITPHIAWGTIEARSRMIRIVADNIRTFQVGDPQNIVN